MNAWSNWRPAPMRVSRRSRASTIVNAAASLLSCFVQIAAVLMGRVNDQMFSHECPSSH